MYVLLLFVSHIALSAETNDADITTQGKTLLQTIHSNEVRNIMRHLKLLIYEREYTELERENKRYQQIRLLVEETKILADTAARLPEIESLNRLNDEEQLTFSAMANQLHEISLELQNEIEANHRQSMSDLYIKLQETCNTCHRLFRNK